MRGHNKYVQDLLGRRFGKWSVLKKGPIGNHNRLWLCRCDCGTEKFVIQTHLLCRRSTKCLKCVGKMSSERARTRNTSSAGHVLFNCSQAENLTQSLWMKDFKQEQFQRQKGKCPICLRLLSENVTSNCFDHDHTTHRSRALVHRGCNVLIGFVERNPEIAERVRKYLEDYSA